MASWFTGRRTRKALGGFGRTERRGKYRHNFKSKGLPLFKSQETPKTRVIRSMVNEIFKPVPNLNRWKQGLVTWSKTRLW